MSDGRKQPAEVIVAEFLREWLENAESPEEAAPTLVSDLARAGLLVEPGSEDRSQWGITWKTHSNGAEQTRYSDFSDDVEYDEDEGGEAAARSCVAWHQDHPMGNKGVRLVRRTVRTSPWRDAS